MDIVTTNQVWICHMLILLICIICLFLKKSLLINWWRFCFHTFCTSWIFPAWVTGSWLWNGKNMFCLGFRFIQLKWFISLFCLIFSFLYRANFGCLMPWSFMWAKNVSSGPHCSCTIAKCYWTRRWWKWKTLSELMGFFFQLGRQKYFLIMVSRLIWYVYNFFMFACYSLLSFSFSVTWFYCESFLYITVYHLQWIWAHTCYNRRHWRSGMFLQHFVFFTLGCQCSVFRVFYIIMVPPTWPHV